MKDQLQHLAVEIELLPGEKLALPPAVIESVGAGRWLVTIEPAGSVPRTHDAFLNGYVAQDEGLYDDDSGG